MNLRNRERQHINTSARQHVLLVFILILLAMGATAQQTKHRYLALGDSYTIGESVNENERWPNQLVDSLKARGTDIGKPRIIATTGWRTDDLRHAMDVAKLNNDYDLVSLLIGVNNQYQSKPLAQYAVEFEDLLKMSIKLANGKKQNVFVVSIPDYGYTPFGRQKQQTITQAIDEFNATNRGIAKQYRVRYIDITEISRLGLDQPELVAADGLHPSAKMYALWVSLITASLAK